MNKNAQKKSISNSGKDSDSKCRRCGTCCENGGPALHHEDRVLIDKGLIPMQDLFTIRKREPAWDQIRCKVIQAESDIIKIRGKRGFRNCLYFEETYKACQVYENRPLECRLLSCRDTTQIERLYGLNRLSRKDLLSSKTGLWELIESHSKEVDYDDVIRLIQNKAIENDKKLQQTLAGIVEYDIAIRELVEKKLHPGVRLSDFLFGRALKETLTGFGIKLHYVEGRLIIRRVGDKWIEPTRII